MNIENIEVFLYWQSTLRFPLQLDIIKTQSKYAFSLVSRTSLVQANYCKQKNNQETLTYDGISKPNISL